MFSNSTNVSGLRLIEDDVRNAHMTLYQYLGIIFLFASAGFNSMLASTPVFDNSPSTQSFIQQFTLVYYILAGSVLIWLISDHELFTDHWTRTFQVLSSLFVAAIGLGYVSSLLGCCVDVGKFVDMTPGGISLMVSSKPATGTSYASRAQLASAA